MHVSSHLFFFLINLLFFFFYYLYFILCGRLIYNKLMHIISHLIGVVTMDSIIMTSTNYEVQMLTSLNDFELWWIKICTFLVQ